MTEWPCLRPDMREQLGLRRETEAPTDGEKGGVAVQQGQGSLAGLVHSGQVRTQYRGVRPRGFPGPHVKHTNPDDSR